VPMPAAHANARPADRGWAAAPSPAAQDPRSPQVWHGSGSGDWSTPSYHGRPARDDPRHGESGPPQADNQVPTRGRTLRYAAGLDGLRALAVTAVLVYHLNAGWLPGGFLGVDVFFVLSGFLITSILATEWSTSGQVRIGRFYVRRARRLLPALITMLATVVLVTAAVAPDELRRLRGDVAAALTYSTNWTQIIWQRSYFEQLGRPSLLQHLWSLAVEEQFYLLWPLVLVVCLRTGGRRRALRITLVGIVASAALMAWLFASYADPGRAYYGSDTHASGLLVGAALALATVLRRPARRDRRPAPLGLTVNSPSWPLDVAALLGAVIVGYFVTRTNYFAMELYRGGFLLVALGSAAIVLAAGRRGTLTARLLGMPLLCWIGVRSYAIYLWHWPVFMLSRPRLDYPSDGLPLMVLRVGLTVALADLSYRFIEHPIRTQGFVAYVRSGLRRVRRGRLGRPAFLMASLAALGLIVGQVVALPRPTAGTASGIPTDLSVRPTRAVTPGPPASPSAHSPSPGAPVTRSAAPFARPIRVTVFGDSQGMTLLLNKPAGLDGSLTLTDGTVEGCGFLLGKITSRRGPSWDLGASCGTWADQWRTNEARSHPQIALVEVGAWDVFDLKVGDGATMAFGSPAWDAYYTQQLNQAVSLLIGGGAQVALLGLPCYRPIDGGGLIALPERGDDQRTQHLNVLLRAAAAKNPERVFMVNPPAQFCTDPAIASNTAYRWDGVHYYKPGAALMFQAITPQLLAIPRPPR
jgi:peptidoglycan/LPS O-acetylase OafA/YrhL